jgi:nucleotide-binding universal stress UspA family protein
MYKRILVPLDGSKTAEKVLPYAISEAQHHRATVVVIRVIAPLRKSLRGIPNLIERAGEHMQDIVEEYLEDVSERLCNEGLVVETRLDQGPPALRILEYAIKDKCDLIIVGSYGETRAVKWRFGSVASYIVRAKTSIPILIIPT